MENIVPFLAQLPKEKRFAHLSVSPSPLLAQLLTQLTKFNPIS